MVFDVQQGYTNMNRVYMIRRVSFFASTGGCQTFLKAFYRLHKRAVADPTNAGLDPVFAQQMQMGPQVRYCTQRFGSLFFFTSLP